MYIDVYIRSFSVYFSVTLITLNSYFCIIILIFSHDYINAAKLNTILVQFLVYLTEQIIVYGDNISRKNVYFNKLLSNFQQNLVC